ncbi:MAG: gamma-glutamyltranspeptidase [Monoraphidium minutum]|nr:MAG: gamma-glutamyltranspeptidase [Monoraphidium minutum]
MGASWLWSAMGKPDSSTYAPLDVEQTGEQAWDDAGYAAAAAERRRPPPPPQPSVWNDHGGALPAAGPPSAPAGRPDGFVPCEGLSDLACGMVNPQPRPGHDFRGLPRRVEAAGGVVAADSSRCSEIGAAALAEGGHAADAAVATALCQGVVNPIASGLGGGAFILVRLANGSAEFIDAREPAPAAATATMFDDKDKAASVDGGLAVAIPCELRGLEALWRRYGRLPWRRLVQPAAALARSGFGAHPYLVYSLSGPYNFNRVKSIPALRDAFLVRNGSDSWRPPAAGELCCRRPRLADTLDAIAEHGAGWLYTGEVAEKLAAEVQAAGGIMTADDIQGVAAPIRQPLMAQLGGLDLIFPPPPSSAAVVAFALRFLAGYDGTLQNATADDGNTIVDDDDDEEEEGGAGGGGAPQAPAAAAGGRRRRRLRAARLSFGGGGVDDGGLGLQRMIEAQKHGFAVRTALGDPGPEGAPFAHADEIWAATRDLLDAGFTDSLRAATRDGRVLAPEAYGGRWNPIGRGAPPDDHGTTHFNVVDRDRNAISITSTVNTPFGSGVVSESTGVLFNNEMDDFSQPNRTSLVTPHPSPANFIAPGKRPLSAMSPIVAVERASGRLVAVTGASGGPLIVSATLQTLARLLLEGADVADAVAPARLHDQLLPLPTKTFFEGPGTWFPLPELPRHILEELQRRGQDLQGMAFGLGVSQAVAVRYGDEEGGGASEGDLDDLERRRRRRRGTLIAMSDARKDGAPFAAD